MAVRFELVAVDPTGARAGILHTPHGSMPTPAFMPVATHANIESLSPQEIATGGARTILANTYHLWLAPGPDRFLEAGGIHRFMGWDGPILTDSGGFQIFSLAADCEVDEEGAFFRGWPVPKKRRLTPEESIRTQIAIGSDVMMALDVCPPSTVPREQLLDAMGRTHRWAIRSLEARAKVGSDQALFGIVQGGLDRALREESAAFITSQPFDGYAIGGLAVGDTKDALWSTAAFTAKLLPQDKARYLMGVGKPGDILEAVAAGVDMFDCIIPTKMAQQGFAYVPGGVMRMKRQAFKSDYRPIQEGCPCATCTSHTRAYLQHLLSGKRVTGRRLLAIHNLTFYQRHVARMREAILSGTFASLLEEQRALKLAA